MEKKKILVAVSGGFDPIHIGHVRMFEKARALGDELVVILNNDNWLRKKKRYIFMPQEERKEIIEALRMVDRVVLTKHPVDPIDMTVAAELREVRPDIFANGGDQVSAITPEAIAAKEVGCKMVFGIGDGGKIQSSSWLLEGYVKRVSADSQSQKS